MRLKNIAMIFGRPTIFGPYPSTVNFATIGAIYFEALLLSPRGSIMKIFSKESIISLLVLVFIVYFVKSYKMIGR